MPETLTAGRLSSAGATFLLIALAAGCEGERPGTAVASGVHVRVGRLMAGSGIGFLSASWR